MGDVHCTPILDIDAEAHIVIKNDHPNRNGQGSAKSKGWIRQDRCFVVRYEWEEARKDRRGASWACITGLTREKGGRKRPNKSRSQ